MATLAVSHRETSRYLLFNEEDFLCGWKNVNTGEIKMAFQPERNFLPFAFSGIHLISSSIFPLITEEGKFSIIETYLRLAADHRIGMFQHKEKDWVDVGKPPKLIQSPDIIAALVER